MIFPTITLYQPWATWIMRGWKTIETRTHNRFECLKGKTILIHAGLTTDASASNNEYLTKDQIMFNPEEMVNGFVLGSAYVWDFSRLNGIIDSRNSLIDCISTTRYGLHLEHIKKFDHPIPVRGEMGIWYFDMDKKEKVKKPKNEIPTLF